MSEMRSHVTVIMALLACLGCPIPSAAQDDHAASGEHRHLHVKLREAEKAPPVLPPLPEGVVDLSFSDFYKMPIGPRGLEPTEKLLSMGGKRVRLVGYMVHAEEPIPGVFMLAPFPVSLAERADGPADDLPANTVFVRMPADDRDAVLPYQPGRWVLTGEIELGAREEADGRMSYVRLSLEKDGGAQETVAAESK